MMKKNEDEEERRMNEDVKRKREKEPLKQASNGSNIHN